MQGGRAATEMHNLFCR